MPRLIKPEEGMPADLLLDELGSNDEKYDIRGAWLIQDLVNSDVCLKPRQQRWLKSQFAYDALPDDQSDLNEEQMASVINSFRFECADCLNQDCARRDPATSFTEIKKRDEFYDDDNDLCGAGLKFSTSEMWDVLIEARIRTVGDLCERTEGDLLALPGASPEFVDELKKYLSEYGLQLKDEPKNE